MCCLHVIIIIVYYIQRLEDGSELESMLSETLSAVQNYAGYIETLPRSSS